MKRIGLTILFLILLIVPVSGQVAVIANKSVPADTISKNKLVDFYTGDIKIWGDKSRVVVLDLKPRLDIRKAFYNFLGKSSSRMKSIWLKKMLSGEGDPPLAVDSEDEMIKKVADTPGAIGFVSQAKLTPAVKAVLVIPEKK